MIIITIVTTTTTFSSKMIYTNNNNLERAKKINLPQTFVYLLVSRCTIQCYTL